MNMTGHTELIKRAAVFRTALYGLDRGGGKNAPADSYAVLPERHDSILAGSLGSIQSDIRGFDRDKKRIPALRRCRRASYTDGEEFADGGGAVRYEQIFHTPAHSLPHSLGPVKRCCRQNDNKLFAAETRRQVGRPSETLPCRFRDFP